MIILTFYKCSKVFKPHFLESKKGYLLNG